LHEKSSLGTHSKLAIGVRIGATGFFEDGCNHVVEVVIGIWVIEAFREAVDEDTRVRGLDIDFRVRTIGMADGQEKIASRLVRISGAKGAVIACACALALIVKEVIANDGVDLDFTHEAAFGFDNTEEEHGDRDADCGVDAVFDTGEDGDDDASEEDDDFEWRDTPELVNGVGRCDKVTNGVDDDCRKAGIGYVEEDCRQRIYRQEDYNGCDDTSKRSPDTCLRFDGSSREGSSSRICPEEGPKQICNSNGHHFLRWVNGVIVNPAE